MELLLDAAAALVHRVAGEVRSSRGAVPAFRLVRFLGPPPEPGVRVPSHPALHKPRWSGGCLEFGPWRLDVAPVAVASDRHTLGVEQRGACVLRPPPVGGV